MPIKSKQYDLIKSDIEELSRDLGYPVLVLCGDITRDVSHKLFNLLSNKNFENLFVFLQTPGGDIDAAYVIAKLLKKSSKKLTLVVPTYAKSAGTLICLAADDLVLTDLSELGPLDAQVPETRDGGTKYVSALNGFKALESVLVHSLETHDSLIKSLLQKTRIGVVDAIKLSTDFTAKTSAKLYSRMDPNKIAEYARALEIAEAYGHRVLTRFMGWEDGKAQMVISNLVKSYPSHGYIIDYDELVSLQIPVSKPVPEIDSVVSDLRNLFSEGQIDNILLLSDPNDQNISTDDKESKE